MGHFYQRYLEQHAAEREEGYLSMVVMMMMGEVVEQGHC
jgi:hypothetical protein